MVAFFSHLIGCDGIGAAVFVHVLRIGSHLIGCICSCVRWLVCASALLEFVQFCLFECLSKKFELDQFYLFECCISDSSIGFFWAMMRPSGMMARADCDHLLSQNLGRHCRSTDHCICELERIRIGWHDDCDTQWLSQIFH